MTKTLIMLLLSVSFFLYFSDLCTAQEMYNAKIRTLDFGDGFVRNIKPHEVKKVAYLKMKFNRSPWRIEFKDFIDSLKAISSYNTESEESAISNRDFRIHIVIRHKYLLFIRHVLYCDRFGYFVYKGQIFQNDMLFDLIMECIPPSIIATN